MKEHTFKYSGITNEHSRFLLDSSPNMVIMFDSDLTIADCNPVAQKFMGFASKDELLAGFSERLKQVTPKFQSDGQLSPSLYDHLCLAAKTGHSKFETEIHQKGVRNLNVVLKRISYGKSYVVVAYFSDISHIREREMELLHARELNELQLTKLGLVVKATKIGLFDIEVEKDNPVNIATPVIWSDEIRHMLGFTTEDNFPNILSSISERLHPEDKEKALEGLFEHMFDKSGKTPYDMEFRLLNKDGEYRYFHAYGETIRDEEGNPLRVVGSAMDITETKNILLDTEKQRLAAQAANQAKSAFLSTMSHEIRTPMNAILGITEIQLQNEKLEPGVKEAFEKIYISSDLLLGIINDILDLSKIEAGKMELVVSNYNIASLVSDVAQLNMMRIGSKPIKFELVVDEHLPTNLLGDELRVKQILNNLLSNAFKYTSKGVVKLSVFPLAGGDEQTVNVVFSVSDTGQGMTGEQITRMFDEYSRFNLQTNRKTEGTGLGMSITQNLIHLMNGEISIESEPGQGSVFTVRLPQGKAGAEVLGRQMAENLKQFRTLGRAQMKRMQITREPMPYGRVIVVDDVEANIYVAKGLLIPYALKFDYAYSGFEIIEKIKNGNVYDIVFMDHMMPKMDGIEAVKIMRSMGYEHPIVALTANAVAGQADIFLNNGFDDFISKPIDLRQLNAVLNRLIRDKQPPEIIAAARRQAAAKKEQATAVSTPQPAVDPRFAEIFIRDAAKCLVVLEEINNKNGLYNDEDIRTYIIYTHGIKSSLANIGQMRLSAVALKLEMTGREGNHAVIASETPAFINALQALVEELSPSKEANAPDVAVDEDQPYLRKKLRALAQACREYDEQSADDIITELREKTWTRSTQEFLYTVAKYLLHSDFDEILQAIEKLDMQE